MGNCFSGILLFFRAHLSDYEILDIETNVESVPYQSTQGNSVSSPQKTRKRRKRIPKDAIGEIVSFIESPLLFFSIFMLSRGMKRYLSRSNFSRNVLFDFVDASMLPKKKKRKSGKTKSFFYVFRMRIKMGSDFNDDCFQFFPNIRELHILRGEYIKGTGLSELNYLQSLNLCESDLPGQYLHSSYSTSKYLKHLSVDRCKNICDDDILQLKGLESLHLRRIMTENFKKLNEFNRLPMLTELELCESLIPTDFTPPSKIQTLRILNSKSANDELFRECFDLEVLEIRYNDKITGKYFHQLSKLKEMTLQWLDQLAEDSLPKQLKYLKVQGCYGIKDSSFKELTNLESLEMIEQNELTDQCFEYLHSIRILRLNQCNTLTNNIFQYLEHLEKVRIIRCNQIMLKDIQNEFYKKGITILSI